MNVYGELTNAQLENFASAGAEPAISSSVPARMWWRSDINKLRVQTGTGITEINHFVTPQEFGAKGDNSHDDTAAFQAALDTGKLVYAPPGTYLISSTLSIKAAGSGIIGAGNDSGGTFLKFTGASGTLINASGAFYSGILLRDFAAGDTSGGGVVNSLTVIDISLFSTGSRLEHLSLQTHGTNGVCIYGKPPTTSGGVTFGGSPYYVEMHQVDCTGGSIAGSIGIWFDVNLSAGGDGSHQGPNGNRVYGGRIFGVTTGIKITAGQQNSFYAIDFETILNGGNAIELGTSTADETKTVSSATQNTVTPSTLTNNTVNFYAGGGLSVTTASDSTTRYYEIISNTTTVIAIFGSFEVVPAASDSISFYAKSAVANDIRACRQEGASGSNFLKAYLGATSTNLDGTSNVSSLGGGKLVSAFMAKASDRYNPERYADPFPITFVYGTVLSNLSDSILPWGLFAPYLSIYPWQVTAISVSLSANITAGSLTLNVLSNGAAINLTPDVKLDSTNLYLLNSNYNFFKQVAPEAIATTSLTSSGGRGLSLAINTTNTFLPVTANLSVTLWIQHIR